MSLVLGRDQHCLPYITVILFKTFVRGEFYLYLEVQKQLLAVIKTNIGHIGENFATYVAGVCFKLKMSILSGILDTVARVMPFRERLCRPQLPRLYSITKISCTDSVDRTSDRFFILKTFVRYIFRK